MTITEAQRNEAVEFFKDVQNRLLSAFENVDGEAKADTKEWDRPGGGGGRMGVIRGNTVEKAGANVSVVHGERYPNMESEYAGKPFFAAGVSTITHMYNPKAPIGHMNVRIFTVGDTFWFGGGADLTPFIKYEEDTKLFHDALKKACEKHADKDAYEKYSKWCDEYFYIKHRKSVRGVGGIFFDFLKGDFEELFPFVKATADAYVETFPKILNRRKLEKFTEEEKEGQLFWRGRYAEFNLVYDRGTRFGLESDGNIEAIFVSMPPVVKW